MEGDGDDNGYGSRITGHGTGQGLRATVTTTDRLTVTDTLDKMSDGHSDDYDENNGAGMITMKTTVLG